MDGVVDLAVKALHGGEVMLEAAAQAQIRPGATAVRRGWGSAVAGREKGDRWLANRHRCLLNLDDPHAL